MKEKKIIKPNFLYVGAAKSGSSWIYECLREHPQVFVPIAKDLKYFNDGYTRMEFKKYLSYFQPAEDKIAIGELSHDYFCQEEYAERIAQHLPDVKIIICLREPGDQIVSLFKYTALHQYKKHGLKYFYDNFVLAGGRMPYLRNLKFFYDRFSPENILVLFYEDLKKSPVAFLEELYNFLKVDPGFRPTVLGKKVNAARSLRFNWRVQRGLYLLTQFLRTIGLHNFIGKVKRNSRIVSIFYSMGKTPDNYQVQEFEIEQIRSHARKDYPEIEKLIGKRLPDEWYVNAPNKPLA